MIKRCTVRMAMFATLVMLIVCFGTPASAMPVPQAGAALSPVQADPPVENAISVDSVGELKCLHTLSGHRDKVLALAISGDGA
ncbi:MAG: hypothetical protein JSU96_02645, partial [Acidobacteriota bacterium]